MKKKHIIFDMDGTLSDTAKATEKAFIKVKEKHSLPVIPIERIYDAMGLHGLDFHAFLLPGKTKEELEKISFDVDIIEDEMVRKIGKDILFPGVGEMLKTLVDKGISVYIASTANNVHVDTTLTTCGIKNCFTAISCNEPNKHKMIETLIDGRDKTEWAMVGDMYKDSEAAASNGILALGAGFGYLSKEDYKLFDEVLETPSEIFNFI